MMTADDRSYLEAFEAEQKLLRSHPDRVFRDELVAELLRMRFHRRIVGRQFWLSKIDERINRLNAFRAGVDPIECLDCGVELILHAHSLKPDDPGGGLAAACRLTFGSDQRVRPPVDTPDPVHEAAPPGMGPIITWRFQDGPARIRYSDWRSGRRRELAALVDAGQPMGDDSSGQSDLRRRVLAWLDAKAALRELDSGLDLIKMYEAVQAARRKKASDTARKNAQKPRRRIGAANGSVLSTTPPLSEATSLADLCSRAAKAAGQDATSRETWPHFFGVLDQAGLGPVEIDDDTYVLRNANDEVIEFEDFKSHLNAAKRKTGQPAQRGRPRRKDR